jgi:misacylated tRNA(Ala) deacylase
MTEQRYLVETDRRSFDATVERVAGDRVVLDRSCFYPTGGGQPHDTGTLAAGERRWRVVDVSKRDTVYHRLAPIDGEGRGDDAEGPDGDATGEVAPPVAGTTVHCELDWDRRYAHMRYHTAQHLLSALLLEEYDAETTGNQLYHDHAHLDAAYDRFTETDLADVEAGLDALVDDDLPVRWYELPREEAEARLDPARTRIHLLPDSITEVRIVEVGGDGGRGAVDGPGDGGRGAVDGPGDGGRGAVDGPGASGTASAGGGSDPYDRTACAGTHVSGTAEIGEVSVTGRETKGADEERIRFELASR